MAGKAQMAVGSIAWITAEKENALQLLEQEKEEIVYPAQHEMEWLNEHMAEIFSRTPFNVTDLFKTPGKLRGKTPRTARKRNVPEARIPLSDVFSSQAQSMASPRQNKLNRQKPHFEIAKDTESGTSKPEAIPKQNTDSGYHGMTDDDMEVDAPSQPSSQGEHGSTRLEPVPAQTTIVRASEGRRTTEGSFHSAKEEQTARLAATLMQSSVPKENPPAKTLHREEEEMPLEKVTSPEVVMEDAVPEKRMALDMEHDFSDIGSPSDGSTPDRPLVRKSSLTFASLPAREPLTTKKSIGNRNSHIDQISRNSYIGRLTGGSRLTQAQLEVAEPADKDINDAPEIDGPRQTALREDSDAETRATRMHNKSSTQQLHEKINMLGKTQQPRQSKSIPNLVALTTKHNHVSAETAQPIPTDSGPSHKYSADDDDSWIQPLESTPPLPALTKSHTMDMMENIPERDTVGDLDWHIPAPEQWYAQSHDDDDAPGPSSPPKFGHQKSASTVTLVSPGKSAMAYMGHSKNVSVSNPSNHSMTPYGSPKRAMDGPLSASKSKLQSIMKTAKNLFTSSAGVSAAAKMETLSPTAVRAAANNMPGLYPNISAMIEEKPLPPSPPKEPRRTRSSTERQREEEKHKRERQKMNDQLEKAREKERQKANDFRKTQENASLAKPERPPTRVSPRRAQEESSGAPANGPSHQAPALKTNEARRPVRPTKETLQKSRPPTVAIKVGTMSQRVLPQANGSAHTQDALTGPSASKPTLTKKASTTSINTTASGSSFKSSVTSQGKPKALVLAAQKREQEEREAQRKAEQKREMERKRAVQQEEARRQEQNKRAENDRIARERAAAEEAKRNAQKQAVEKRRLEAARKAEQQRNQNAAAELATSLHKDPQSHRNDAGITRPPSRMAGAPPMPRSMVNHPLPNPAKPAKRPIEEDGTSNRPQASKYGAASQQADSKRRRTEDESIIEAPPVRPTMAPPIRQSSIKPKASMLPHGYTHAPAPPPIRDTAPQLFGNQQSASAYHPQPYHGQGNRPTHPMEMAKYTNQKIVFADVPNPQAQHQNPFKTPTANHHYSSQQQQRSTNAANPSPTYTNGDNISLPEIPTDSENSDSDATPAKPLPSWASPSALQRTLMEQDANGLDPDTVFGPVAPLRMEEVFAKGTHKDRLKRLRDRTSSARWVESGDILTREEVEKDKIARERIRGEGGWRMGIS